MNYWLVKSEPSTYSIDHLHREKRTLWTGVRNYQARNFLKEMQVKDGVLFYHSSSEQIGIAGVALVVGAAKADPTQFEKGGDYYDPKATLETPRWFAPNLEYRRHFEPIITRKELSHVSALKSLELLRRGSRLSVHPVTEVQFKAILALR